MESNPPQPYFQPVFEAPWYDKQPPWSWKIADTPPFKSISLSGSMTDREVGSMVAVLCDDLEVDQNSNASVVFAELNNLNFFCMNGGLAILEGSTTLISPGCCSGIQDWWELHGVLKCESPWMGHDPDPWCEFLENDNVRFWAGGGISGKQIGPSVLFSQQQVRDEIMRFHNHLQGTMQRLHEWLTSADCQQTDSIVDKFGQSFAITTDEPLYFTN